MTIRIHYYKARLVTLLAYISRLPGVPIVSDARLLQLNDLTFDPSKEKAIRQANRSRSDLITFLMAHQDSIRGGGAAPPPHGEEMTLDVGWDRGLMEWKRRAKEICLTVHMTKPLDAWSRR